MRRTRLRPLSSFRPSRAERELAREIRSPLQLLEDCYSTSGVDPEEARDAAIRAFDGVEQVKDISARPECSAGSPACPWT